MKIEELGCATVRETAVQRVRVFQGLRVNTGLRAQPFLVPGSRAGGVPLLPDRCAMFGRYIMPAPNVSEWGQA